MPSAMKMSIYAEHLEEISFLYEYRKSALEDPELTLGDVAEIEDRLEAHLDGLVLGQRQAAELCRAQAAEGDFGELHGAIRVLCRMDKPNDVLDIAHEIDWKDGERVTAFSDALNFELPYSWGPLVEQWLGAERSELKAVVAKAVGYRRLDVGDALCESAQVETVENVPPYLWALGQLRERGAHMLLYRYMQQEEPDAGKSAAIAALRAGIPQTRGYLQQNATRFSWTPMPMALAGGKEVAPFLADCVKKHRNEEAILALGLLGDAGNVELLCGLLPDTELAGPAALALHLITGADLIEDVPLPDLSDSDELNEQEAIETEEPGPPEPTVPRITQAPEAWTAWWSENESRFQPGLRYRLGEPYSTDVAVRCLSETKIPLAMRQSIADEIVIRYGVDVPFVADMVAAEQTRALSSVRSALDGRTGRSRPGQWEIGA